MEEEKTEMAKLREWCVLVKQVFTKAYKKWEKEEAKRKINDAALADVQQPETQEESFEEFLDKHGEPSDINQSPIQECEACDL